MSFRRAVPVAQRRTSLDPTHGFSFRGSSSPSASSSGIINAEFGARGQCMAPIAQGQTSLGPMPGSCLGSSSEDPLPPLRLHQVLSMLNLSARGQCMSSASHRSNILGSPSEHVQKILFLSNASSDNTSSYFVLTRTVSK